MIPNIGSNQLERIVRETIARITSQETLASRIQTANAVLQTNASGICTVTFPLPYATPPVVFVNAYDVVYHVHQITPTEVSFTFTARNSAGATINNTFIRVGWMAVPVYS